MTRERFIELMVEDGVHPDWAPQVADGAPVGVLRSLTDAVVRRKNAAFLTAYPEYREADPLKAKEIVQ